MSFVIFLSNYFVLYSEQRNTNYDERLFCLVLVSFSLINVLSYYHLALLVTTGRDGSQNPRRPSPDPRAHWAPFRALVDQLTVRPLMYLRDPGQAAPRENPPHPPHPPQSPRSPPQPDRKVDNNIHLIHLYLHTCVPQMSIWDMSFILDYGMSVLEAAVYYLNNFRFLYISECSH